MSGFVALFLWFVGVSALIRFDPVRVRGTSLALWLPVMSLLILMSRLPSQWLGLVDVGTGYVQVLEEGNAFDRSVYLVLMFVSGVVLLRRSFGWGQFCARNAALMTFLLFALLSIAWSDYPFVAFKRWFRDLAQYMTLLVLMTDPRPIDALSTVFRRACYILLPLSVVLIKYFPHIGRQYDIWSGMPMEVGATTSKNMLGVLCLFSALLFVWDTLERWKNRHEPANRRMVWVNAAFLAMTLWLLEKANSATSTLCLVLGIIVVLAAQMRMFQRRPAFLLTALPLIVLTYAALFASGVDLNAWIASLMGRDPTLTGRTLIWQTLLTLVTSPMVGAGYETFWMGPRLQEIWQRSGTINQAHNGYLQVYLNLGLVGLSVLIVFLVVSYLKICGHFMAGSGLGRLGLGVWTVLLFYNVSEAAFPVGPLWLMLLGTSLSIPRRDEAVPRRQERTALQTRPLAKAARPERSVRAGWAGQRARDLRRAQATSHKTPILASRMEVRSRQP